MDIKKTLAEMFRLPEFHKRDKLSLAIIVIFILTLAWFVGAAFSPFLIPAGTIDLGEDGLVGVRDFTHTISGIENPVASFFYDAGDINCHQKASRSFFLNDNQMPFCARDTAIFLGMAIGVFIMIFLTMELSIVWIILGLVPMGIDGTTQLLLDSYESTNFIRFSTGIIAGIVMGLALGYIIGEFVLLAKENKKYKNRKQPAKNSELSRELKNSPDNENPKLSQKSNDGQDNGNLDDIKTNPE
ncbi:MAG: DUF2085 domain-containing protein [Thermoplasmata archaeon]|nr:DUF2085 domain-containing protein [Thermoplasmata archaeon]